MRIRWDRANRSFFTLVVVALLPYLFVGVVGCGLLGFLAYQVASHGFGTLSSGGHDLWPAVGVFVLLGIGTGLAAWSGWRQLRATDRLEERIGLIALPVPPALAELGDKARLRRRLDYVDATQAFAFAYGLGRPRVVVSRGLFQSASPSEMAAVLEHERYHVANFDPAKVVVARVCSAAYFFLPALRGLRTRYGATSELAADRRAMSRCGHAALAGALHRVVRGPDWSELTTAAAMASPELLEVRVSQLETGHEPDVAPVSRAGSALTVLALAALATALVVAVVSAGGPNALMRASMGTSSGGASGMGNMHMGYGVADLWWLVPVALVAALAWWRHSRRPLTLQARSR
jgi:Zn-dependent protease with chaperone function